MTSTIGHLYRNIIRDEVGKRKYNRDRLQRGDHQPLREISNSNNEDSDENEIKQEHTLNKLKAYGELSNPNIISKKMGRLLY
eukprot:XP_016657934.1 PREDICTED: uncharacterized protein LOC107883068 isoform X4 [Acyrthosiphon pisum]